MELGSKTGSVCAGCGRFGENAGCNEGKGANRVRFCSQPRGDSVEDRGEAGRDCGRVRERTGVRA